MRMVATKNSDNHLLIGGCPECNGGSRRAPLCLFFSLPIYETRALRMSNLCVLNGILEYSAPKPWSGLFHIVSNLDDGRVDH